MRLITNLSHMSSRIEVDRNQRYGAACEVERIDPLGVPKGILSVHQIRYEFAKQFCSGKIVLDIACGVGYGSEMLAHVAQYVIGCDLSKDAIDFARANYQRSNLTCLVEDARTLSFRDGVFDTVVSFETIEHLTDIPQYLKEVCRVLKPGGTYVVSTPKVRRTTRTPKNPHHTVEFSEEDFRILLEKYFPAVELYGQVRAQGHFHYWLQKLDVFGFRHYLPNGLRWAVDRKLGTTPFEEMDLSDQRIVKSDLRRAHDMIAVCIR